MRNARCGRDARCRDWNAIWPPDPCDSDLSEDIPGFFLRSYERLQGSFSDMFGLTISQGGLMNMLRRAQRQFAGGRDDAVSRLRQASVISSDETGVRIEGAAHIIG